VYSGIEALMSYEFGLVAVVLGLLVGQGRKASSARGGLTRVGPNWLCLPFGRESIGAPE